MQLTRFVALHAHVPEHLNPVLAITSAPRPILVGGLARILLVRSIHRFVLLRLCEIFQSSFLIDVSDALMLRQSLCGGDQGVELLLNSASVHMSSTEVCGSYSLQAYIVASPIPSKSMSLSSRSVSDDVRSGGDLAQESACFVALGHRCWQKGACYCEEEREQKIWDQRLVAFKEMDLNLPPWPGLSRLAGIRRPR